MSSIFIFLRSFESVSGKRGQLAIHFSASILPSIIPDLCVCKANSPTTMSKEFKSLLIPN